MSVVMKACPTCAPLTRGCYGEDAWGDAMGDGRTVEARAIAESFYPHQVNGPHAEALAWCDKIGQAEVDHLVANGRLRAFRDDRWVSVPRTAAEVNAANRSRRAAIDSCEHDGYNRMLLVAFRCERLGIASACPDCHGYGRRPPKASDIDDVALLFGVEIACHNTGSWQSTDRVAAQWQPFPHKVVAAKLERLMRRGLLTGCACGCRGDWELTEAGRALAGITGRWRPNPAEGASA